MSLCFLRFGARDENKPHRDTALLRSIKTLERINTKPAAEFYEAVESYQAAAKKQLAYLTPAFDQWIKEVAAMPAQKQAADACRKLQK
jgi:hypothetical protein